MSFKIPQSAISNEAAKIGIVSLLQFINLAIEDTDSASRQIALETQQASVEEVKEAFYVYLYKKLLAKEISELGLPRTETNTPYTQYLDFVLEAASRLVLMINYSADQGAIDKPIDFKAFVQAAKKANPGKILKYFYADYLSLVYGFHLAQRMDQALNDNEDFKKIEIRNTYLNARIKHSLDTLYLYSNDFEFKPDLLNSERGIFQEVDRFIKKLSGSPYAMRFHQRSRPLTRYVVCGGAAESERIFRQLPRGGIAGRIIKLDARQNGNVDLHLGQIEQILGKKLSPESRDLLEIAGCLYVSDTLVSRGPRWRRSIHLAIPVRRLLVWESLTSFLSYAVSFLSGDSISFEFYPYPSEEKKDEVAGVEEKKIEADGTCLLSGGADSFAGTLRSIKDGYRPVMISHYFQYPIAGVQRDLANFLIGMADKGILNHLQIKAGKNESRKIPDRLPVNRDNSQRTRSFLYYSLATVVAAELGLEEIRVTENGIQSINLPISRAFASTRCGRPTHPRNIYNFNQIINQLYQKKFNLHNVNYFETKAEIIKSAIETPQERGQLKRTATCPNYAVGINFDQRRGKRNCINCGGCYACMLRLAAIHAAGIEFDSQRDVLDPLADGTKLKDVEFLTLVRLASFCAEFARASSKDLLLKYPELSLPASYFPDLKAKTKISELAIGLHKRFASEFMRWLSQEDKGAAIRGVLGLEQVKPSIAVDVHCHVDQLGNSFYTLSKAKYNNLKIVSVARDVRSTKIMFNLANYFDSIIPSAGLHPLDVGTAGSDIDDLFRFMEKTRFIGEIGLDYYLEKSVQKRSAQRGVFGEILKYCEGKDKVLNVHSKGAEKDVLDLLEKHGAQRVILHWFTGPEGLHPRVIKDGYYVSINRSAISTEKTRGLIRAFPKELILTESDAPAKFRGCQNSPFDIPDTVKEVARIWGMTQEEAQLQIINNFKALVK